ncbi:MAG: peptidase C39 family protein [Armatimonadota bacterium]
MIALVSAIAGSPLGESFASTRCFVFSDEKSFENFVLTNARWSPVAKGITVAGLQSTADKPLVAVVESPEITVQDGFNQAIMSWNARTPPGSYLMMYLSVKINGTWTNWYKMGLWNRDGQPELPTSFKNQEDEWAHVDTDVLILKKTGQAIKAKVESRSVDGSTYPVLLLLSISVIHTDKHDPKTTPYKSVWGKELDVPEISQLSVEGGRGWCSPASVAMVLNYWAKKLNRSELAVGITETAHAVFDKAWGGTGNWTFNTAFAGEFAGIKAYVTRFDSICQLEQMIAKGIPVIVSVDYNRLNRRKTEVPMGHLMVVRGFTRSGNVIFNDPWARLDKGQKVRKVFKREDFEKSWLGSKGSHGTLYLITPEEM